MKCLIFLLILAPSFVFSRERCPKFTEKTYKCVIEEDGDVRIEKAKLNIRDFNGKKILIFTPEEALNGLIMDKKIHKNRGGFKYRSYCKNKRAVVELPDLNLRVLFSGNRRRAVMRAYLHKEMISKAKCSLKVID